MTDGIPPPRGGARDDPQVMLMSDASLYLRGQFLFGPKRLPSMPGVSNFRVGDQYWLHVGKGLSVVSVRSRCGTQWWLIGHAFQSDPTRLAPAAELADAVPTTVDGIHLNWSGSWVLVGGGKVRTDATASLQCLRYQEWVASNVVGFPDRPQTEDAVALNLGWAIPPRSGFADVAVLLPSQQYDYDSKKVEASKRFTDVETRRETDALEELARRYVTIVRNIASESPLIKIPITAGIDSRTVLAISYAAGVSAECYTFRKPWLYHTRADLELPPHLASLAGFRHKLIHSGKVLPQRVAKYDMDYRDRQSVPGSHYYYYTNSYWDALDRGSAVLSGLVGEFGRRYFSLPGGPQWDDYFVYAPATDSNYYALAALLDWWKQEPRCMEPEERFYWEARLAGWAGSAIGEARTTLAQLSIAQIPLFNCERVLSIILGLGREVRSNGRVSRALVERLLPQASTLPYNSLDPLPKRFLRKLALAKRDPGRAWRATRALIARQS